MQRPYRVPSTDPAILWCVGVTVATLGFGRLQNTGHLVGGDISVAKTLWLNLTILGFLVLPGLWWRDRGVDPRMRTIFGVVFAAFLARGAIELPILYLTDWWRCSYGIAHDLSVASVVLALLARARLGGADVGRRAGALVWLIVALLVVEAGFAYAFCSVAHPAAGIYFASDDIAFRAINRATWAAVAVGYSTVALILVLSRPRGAHHTDPLAR